MATALTGLLVPLLRELSALLLTAGDDRRGRSLADLAHSLEDSSDEKEQKDVVRQVLRIYGGMASFNDLVLQDRNGVRPASGAGAFAQGRPADMGGRRGPQARRRCLATGPRFRRRSADGS